MKNIFLKLILFFSFAFTASAQNNLVPNPSFETHTSCPNNPAQIANATPWYGRPGSSTDYYNTCGSNNYSAPLNGTGYQNAKNGSAYGGIYLFFKNQSNAREFLEGQLTSTLQAGKKYCVRFYVSLADSFQYAISNISALLSANGGGTIGSQYFTYNPQINNPTTNYISDKIGWTMVLDSFVAVGNERYLTIGNFENDLNTDTSYVGGSSTSGFPYDWREAYYYVDDIWVGLCDSMTGIYSVNKKQSQVKCYPNPSSDQVIFEFNNNELKGKNVSIEIYNAVGKKVSTEEFLYKEKIQVNLNDLPSGIYFYKLSSKEIEIGNGKLSLIK